MIPNEPAEISLLKQQQSQVSRTNLRSQCQTRHHHKCTKQLNIYSLLLVLFKVNTSLKSHGSNSFCNRNSTRLNIEKRFR